MGTLRRVTDAQVKELRTWLHQGASLKKAAMKAAMDRKSARKYRDLGQLPSQTQLSRTWRTRPDPLAAVWPQLEALLQNEPGLQAVTLLDWLQRTYPGSYPDSVRRTLERRVRTWKAQYGPAKEVYFAQVHEPGRLGASDFTHMDSLGVTIAGEPFDHMLYHFVLTYSNWEHVTLCFSESFASLSAGLQNALWALGGVPQRHRTDRLTMAVNADGQKDTFTAKYQEFLSHYGLVAEATNAASPQENGDCEQSHRRFKDVVEQALLLRGSRDFATRAEYEVFLRGVEQRRNAGRAAAFATEAKALGPLPARRLESSQRRRVRVQRGSTIQVQRNTYSVPARLVGEWVEVRIGVEEIEVWYAEALVQRMPRLRGQGKHTIDYRHIISWLVRKPGAFARYAYRTDLYPTTTFRRAYDALQQVNPASADRDYVQVLYLASQEGQSRVEAALEEFLRSGEPLGVRALRARLGQETPVSVAAAVQVAAVDLRQYDALLTVQASTTEGEMPAVVPEVEEMWHDAEPKRRSHALSDGIALADHACAVRGGGAASNGGDVGLCRVSAGAGPTGVSATTGEPSRAPAEGIEIATGQELGGAGSEAAAGKGGAAVAGTLERRFFGPAGERAGVRTTGFGEDALPGGGGPGVGALGSAGVVHDLRSLGAGAAGGQAGLRVEGAVEALESVGGVDPGRPGLCTTKPRGDGGIVPAAGGAVRAGECAVDEQSAVLAVGADLQGSDDDRGGGGSLGASQHHRGAEHPQLPGGGGQAGQATRGVGGEGVAVGRSGSAAVALAALGLPPLRPTAPPQDDAAMTWGKIIVAKGEG